MGRCRRFLDIAAEGARPVGPEGDEEAGANAAGAGDAGRARHRDARRRPCDAASSGRDWAERAAGASARQVRARRDDGRIRSAAWRWRSAKAFGDARRAAAVVRRKKVRHGRRGALHAAAWASAETRRQGRAEVLAGHVSASGKYSRRTACSCCVNLVRSATSARRCCTRRWSVRVSASSGVHAVRRSRWCVSSVSKSCASGPSSFAPLGAKASRNRQGSRIPRDRAR